MVTACLVLMDLPFPSCASPHGSLWPLFFFFKPLATLDHQPDEPVNFLFSYIFIYLFDRTGSWLQHVGI